MKKILLFATYTIANPQHGGQKRVRALYDTYKKLHNVDIKFSAIYFPLHYKESWPDDIPLNRQHSSLMAKNPLTGDVITGNLVAEDLKIKNKVKVLIKEFNPNVIHIEQPFLYLGIKRILKELNYQGKLVYGSQNIEYPMKQEMLENENFDMEFVTRAVKQIKDIEIEIIKDADLTLAVSEDDLEGIIRLGGQKSKVVLARNGIEKQVTNQEQEKYWNDYFNEHGIKKIALFVGSAHPPNWTGFQAMVGHKIGFLHPDERIVLAGSIGEYFEKHYNHGTMEEVLFWKRIISVGRLSEEKLTGLIQRADCLLLPMIEGGGSNLKTAEALLSEKPVVGTSHAFRAFESFVDFPTVRVIDDESKFRVNIADAIRTKSPSLTEYQKTQLEEVTWDKCLRNAMEGVMSL